MNRLLDSSAPAAGVVVILLSFSVCLQAGGPTPDVDIIPFGSPLRYFQPLTLNQNPTNHINSTLSVFDADWYKPDFIEEALLFDDPGAPNADPGTGIATVAWQDGTTPIGYGVVPGLPNGFATELPTPDSGDRSTVYLRIPFAVPEESTGLFVLELLADDGAAFYLDGQILDVNPLDAGNDRFNCCVNQAGISVPQGGIPVFTDRAGTNQPTAGNDASYAFRSFRSTLTAGDHLLGASLHNVAPDSADMGLDFRIFKPGNGRPWGVDASGDWADARNWAIEPADTNFEFAVFGSVNTAPHTIWTDAGVNVDGVQFDSAFAYNIAGNGTINVNGGGLNSLQGDHRFLANVTLGADTEAFIAADSSITFQNGLNLNSRTLTKSGSGSMIIGNSANAGGGGVVVNEGGLAGTGVVIPGDLTVAGSLSDQDGQTTVTDGSASFDGTITVSTRTTVGAATALGANSTASASGSFDIGVDQANLWDVMLGSAVGEGNEATNAAVQAALAVYSVQQTLTTNNWTSGSALSAGGQARVDMVQSDATAQTVNNNRVTVGTVQTSAAPGGAAPDASIDQIVFSVLADDWNVTNGISFANISASGSGPATANIGHVTGTADVDRLTADSITLASMFAASEVTADVGSSSWTIMADETNLASFTDVGTLTLANGASGVIENALLHVLGGSYTAAGGSAPDLRIAKISVFTPVALAKTTATAKFENVAASIERNIEIATTNSAGAGPGSSADGTLQLINSEMAVGGDVMVGVDSGVAAIASGTAIIQMNPSILDIAGDLLLGDRATLNLGIEGLTRPVPGVLGDYSAIDAANAALDGQLVLSFNFPGVQLGDSFEVIRLDAGGTFTGFFDQTGVVGLPTGLTASAQVVSEILMATIVELPSLAGDFNGDGMVDGHDFLAWQRGESPDPFSQFDLTEWEANYGMSVALAGSSSQVPEPETGFTLMSVMVAMFLGHRRAIPVHVCA
ncbi:hypothetical protein OAS39_11600 [Pirellulales bacterium]|nr:hypothetical protein [Pirellulales bacterium]